MAQAHSTFYSAPGTLYTLAFKYKGLSSQGYSYIGPHSLFFDALNQFRSMELSKSFTVLHRLSRINWDELTDSDMRNAADALDCCFAYPSWPDDVDAASTLDDIVDLACAGVKLGSSTTKALIAGFTAITVAVTSMGTPILHGVSKAVLSRWVSKSTDLLTLFSDNADAYNMRAAVFGCLRATRDGLELLKADPSFTALGFIASSEGCENTYWLDWSDCEQVDGVMACLAQLARAGVAFPLQVGVGLVSRADVMARIIKEACDYNAFDVLVHALRTPGVEWQHVSAHPAHCGFSNLEEGLWYKFSEEKFFRRRAPLTAVEQIARRAGKSTPSFVTYEAWRKWCEQGQ